MDTIPTDIINVTRDLAAYIGLDWVYAAAALSLSFMLARTLWRKHKAGVQSFFDSERVMNVLVIIAAYGEAALDFFLHTPSANPAWIGVQGLVQRELMQNLYVFVFKPYVPKLWAAFKHWVASRRSVQEAKALVAAAAVPTPTPALDIRSADVAEFKQPGL